VPDVTAHTVPSLAEKAIQHRQWVRTTENSASARRASL